MWHRKIPFNKINLEQNQDDMEDCPADGQLGKGEGGKEQKEEKIDTYIKSSNLN